MLGRILALAGKARLRPPDFQGFRASASSPAGRLESDGDPECHNPSAHPLTVEYNESLDPMGMSVLDADAEMPR